MPGKLHHLMNGCLKQHPLRRQSSRQARKIHGRLAGKLNRQMPGRVVKPNKNGNSSPQHNHNKRRNPHNQRLLNGKAVPLPNLMRVGVRRPNRLQKNRLVHCRYLRPTGPRPLNHNKLARKLLKLHLGKRTGLRVNQRRQRPQKFQIQPSGNHRHQRCHKRQPGDLQNQLRNRTGKHLEHLLHLLRSQAGSQLHLVPYLDGKVALLPIKMPGNQCRPLRPLKCSKKPPNHCKAHRQQMMVQGNRQPRLINRHKVRPTYLPAMRKRSSLTNQTSLKNASAI